MTVDTTTLRRLLAEAVPRPWESTWHSDAQGDNQGFREHIILGPENKFVCGFGWNRNPIPHPIIARNQTLIVAAVNTLSELLDRLDELEEIAALVDVLDRLDKE